MCVLYFRSLASKILITVRELGPRDAKTDKGHGIFRLGLHVLQQSIVHPDFDYILDCLGRLGHRKP
jgi:hypothetical protein